MRGVTFTATKGQQVSVAPSAFPLEAYGAPTPAPESPHVSKSTPSKDSHGGRSIQHARSLYSVIRFSLLTILNLWAYFLVTTDLLKVACFNNMVSLAGSTPANVLCSQISPSFTQFWWKILESQTSSTKKIPTYLDIQLSQLQAGLRRREIGNHRRDFALRGAGGFVLIDFTTPTFKPPHSIHNFNHPSIVLEEQLIIGDCWEFSGSKGHIGIHLSEKINITEMTVNYVHPTLISGRMMKKAPRSITVWALTDPSQFSSEQIFVPILEAEYLVASESDLHVQAFPVALNASSQIIVIEINSNWGSPMTCLHHFGIHGIPILEVEA